MIQKFKEFILAIPAVYSFTQWAFGTTKGQRRLLPYIDVQAGDTVLDVGCGTGIILEYLPDVNYYGYDMNEEYLASAKAKYADRNASFRNGYISKMNLPDELAGKCDRVIAIGLLHHIPDEDVLTLFDMAGGALKSGGKFISVDPVFIEGQHPVSRFLVSADRGVHVRHRTEYESLYDKHFEGSFKTDLINMTNFPYDSLVVVAEKP